MVLVDPEVRIGGHRLRLATASLPDVAQRPTVTGLGRGHDLAEAAARTQPWHAAHVAGLESASLGALRNCVQAWLRPAAIAGRVMPHRRPARSPR